MSSPGTVIARCNNCGHTNGFQYASLGSEGIAACPACGLTLRESELQMQDDLTKMFNQSMNLEAKPQANPSSRLSISQHYHHSSHLLAPEAKSQQSRTELSDSEAIEMLAQHGIEAVYLSFSQAALFKKADPVQRDRLIELWRISPPRPSDWQGSGAPRETNLQMEEDLARQRYEASERQATDVENSAEPYIKTVYDTTPKSTYQPYGSAVGLTKAVDQMHGAEWWRDFMGNQPMELQYGMLEYMRYHAASAREDSDMH